MERFPLRVDKETLSKWQGKADAERRSLNQWIIVSADRPDDGTVMVEILNELMKIMATLDRIEKMQGSLLTHADTGFGGLIQWGNQLRDVVETNLKKHRRNFP